jgi:hypothetical protein
MLEIEFKSYAIKKLKFSLSVMVLALIALILSITLDNKSTRKEYLYESELSDLGHKLDERTNLLEKYKRAIVIWNSGLKDAYSQRSGLNIEEAKKIINNLRVEYNIKNLSIGLTSPTPRKDIYGLEFSKLIYSRINIELEAYSDKDVLRFIDGIIDKLPGILQCTSAQMDVKPIDKITGKKMISAKIEILWENVEDIGAS